MCAGPLRRNGGGALAAKVLRPHVFERRARETIAITFTRADAGKDMTRSGEPKLLDVGLRVRTCTDDRIQRGSHQAETVRIVEVA